MLATYMSHPPLRMDITNQYMCTTCTSERENAG